ncbi:MAG: glycosyltransferase family 2 protein [Polyangia bacterium]|jgi:glycosyltransferase involved in cell wall biosynthesis
MKPSISIIIPAYNEEACLASTVEMVLGVLAGRFSDCELLVFDDGSTDRTWEIVTGLAAKDPRIRPFQNPGNMGIGYSYRRGIELAAMSYVTWLGGNTVTVNRAEDLARVFDAVGQADIVIPYLTDDARSLARRTLSRLYPSTLNLLFGLKLRYYHCANIYRTEWIKQVRITKDGTAGVAEALIRSLKAGQSWIEVGIPNRDVGGKSSQMRFSNIVCVIASVLELWWDMQVRRQQR